MKDFAGIKIEIGDTVIAAVSHNKNAGASLSKFKVTGFTPTFVKGIIPDYTGRLPYDNKEGNISPKKCFVIEKVIKT